MKFLGVLKMEWSPQNLQGRMWRGEKGDWSCPDWSGKTQGTDRQGLGRGELGVFGGTSRGDIDEAGG